MSEQVIPIHNRYQGVADVADLIGHTAAAVGVLSAAFQQMPVHTAGETALAGAELLAGAALIGVIAREVRQRMRRHQSSETRDSGVFGVSLFAGTVLLLDWYLAYRSGGKVISPTLLAAVIAFLQPRLESLRQRRRALRITDDGIDLRVTPLRRLHALWSEVSAVEAEGNELRLVMADGSVRRMSLRRAANRDEIMRAAVKAGRRHASAIPAAGAMPAVR